MIERHAYIGFSVFEGIGPLKFNRMLHVFGSASASWNASEEQLKKAGLDMVGKKLVNFRQTFDPISYEKEILEKEIKIVTRIDTGFPEPLKQIPDPPIVLFVKGDLNTRFPELMVFNSGNLAPTIGVVGTRKPTSYGKEVTQKLTRELVAYGFTIVSGMARGVDGIAHRTALELGGKTIAVLGCGVDIIYPPEHKDLYGNILEKGNAIISEVPPGHTVLKGLFPARNRIISGLSLGVIITEGAEDSGSLITARLATEQGKEVFAVPGPITSYLSVGPAKLIKQGAKIVTRVEDVLEELNVNPKSQILNPKPFDLAQGRQIQNQNFKNLKLNGEAKIIVELLLKSGELHYDEIVRGSLLPSSEVGSILSLLELDGIIRALGNGKYGLRS